MKLTALTGYIDLAQILLYAFWIFLFGLIYYLRREDKREGYPLESDRSGSITVQGFPPVPSPKIFRLPHGGEQSAPREEREMPVRAEPVAKWPGAPLEPTGDPMIDGVGPAAYAMRAETPDLTIDGQPKIVPMRVAKDFFVPSNDPNPVGMQVIAADGNVAGVVRDAWIDRSETLIRYFEVEVPTPSGPRHVLLPQPFTKIKASRREIRVASLWAKHFATVPALKNPDQITLREEDRIAAYFASGHLYADPKRMGPIL